LHLPTLQ